MSTPNSLISVVVCTIFLCAKYTIAAFIDFSGDEVSIKYENFKTFSNDERSYRGLTLSNELKVLLVRDPSAKESAVSLVVGVGSLYDVPEASGLANLSGYALIRGGLGYPSPYSFSRFIKDNEGSSRMPLTAENHQKFTFKIKHSCLVEALKRLADAFLTPLVNYDMREEVIKDSISVVDFGYNKRKKIEMSRIEQVEKVVSRKSHPYYRSSEGNASILSPLLYHPAEPPKHGERQPETLAVKVRRFLSMWYSSNIMTLVVLGTESLDELEEMVVPLFRKLENKNARKLPFSLKFHPWGPEQLKNKIYIESSTSIQMLRLNFPTEDFSNNYKTLPPNYVGNILLHEGPHSLVSTLFQDNLCTDLNILYKHSDGIAFFGIECLLTTKGLKNVDRIIYLIFQYIHLIKSAEDGVKERIFEEQKKMSYFSNSRSKIPFNYVEEIAVVMQYCDIEDALVCGEVAEHWEPLLIEKLLKHLHPENMNVTIVSRSFKDKLDKVEPFYQTAYGMEKIPDYLLQKWSAAKHVPGLELPQPNEFIPERLEIIPVDEGQPDDPYIIYTSSISEIWFKQDKEFKTPELHISLELYSPLHHLAPYYDVLINLFQKLLHRSLTTHLSPALLVKFAWDVKLQKNELEITLHGPSDKLPLLLEKLLVRMTNFDDFNEENFLKLILPHLKTWQTIARTDHYHQIRWHIQHLQSQRGWTESSRNRIGKNLRYADMKKFLAKVFRRIFIRGFIHGNCTRENARNIITIIENKFRSSSGLLLQEILRPRMVELSNGSHSTYHILNETPQKYAFGSYFQLNSAMDDIKTDLTSRLLYQLIVKPCQRLLAELTEDMSNCNFLEAYDVKALAMFAKLRTDPRTIDKRMDKFLQNIPSILGGLTNDQFERVKRALQTNILERPSNLYESSKSLFKEITNRSYNFDKSHTLYLLESLQSIKLSSLENFFKEMLEDGAPRRRQLTLHVFPKQKKKFIPTTLKSPSGTTKIEDLDEFKFHSALLPFAFGAAPSSIHNKSEKQMEYTQDLI